MQDEVAVSIPTHIGFIVDGNRRWARQHGVPKYEGHLAGYNALKDIITASVDRGVRYISIYIFSTENWKRAEEEVSYLMRLTVRLLKADLKELIKNEIRIRHIGTRQGLSDKVLQAIDEAEAKTAHLSRGTVGLCFNYGGQREISDAVAACLRAGLQAEEITEETISQHLYAPDIPPVDMIVRTSGEQRISNFMLWRAAYSELLFLDKFWPDMTPDDVDDIITEYRTRQRRFGGN